MSHRRITGATRRLGRLAGLVILTLSRAVLPAAGAEPDPEARPDTSAGLAEVVVTAQFRRENAQTTPIALTAIDAAAMSAQGMTNLADAANEAPSVFIAPAAYGFGQSASVTIRGVGQADPHIALEPG